MKDFFKLTFDTLRAMFYALLIVIGIMGFITPFYSVYDESSCAIVTTIIASFIAVMYGTKNLIRVLKE